MTDIITTFAIFSNQYIIEVGEYIMKIPVFSSYYLDFSYSGGLNMESRVFVSLPNSYEALDNENKTFEAFTLGFEMNSAYKENSGNIMHFLDKETLYLTNNRFKSRKTNKANLIQHTTFKTISDIFSHLEENLPYYLEENRQGFLNAVQTKLNDNKWKHLGLTTYESYEQRINRFTEELNQIFTDIKNNQSNIPAEHFASGAFEFLNDFNELPFFWQKQRLHENLSDSLEVKNNKPKNKI